MNTKSNEELRWKLKKILNSEKSGMCASDCERGINGFESDIDDLLQLIQTEIAEAERRARIDEIQNLPPYTSVLWRVDRIKQLTEIEVSGEREK
jgi:hypothetical protein